MLNLAPILVQKKLIAPGTVINHRVKLTQFGTVTTLAKADLMVQSISETHLICVDKYGHQHTIPQTSVRYIDGMTITRYASVYGIKVDKLANKIIVPNSRKKEHA